MRGGARQKAGRPGWKAKAEHLFHIDVQQWSTQPPEGVHLAYTPCHYGGGRAWFRCPHCARRVAKLYLANGQWYCRRSLNLAYISQSMSAVDRIHHRIAKLESRLNDDGEKPKGMHWSTYNRIVEQYNDTIARLNIMWLKRWR